MNNMTCISSRNRQILTSNTNMPRSNTNMLTRYRINRTVGKTLCRMLHARSMINRGNTTMTTSNTNKHSERVLGSHQKNFMRMLPMTTIAPVNSITYPSMSTKGKNNNWCFWHSVVPRNNQVCQTLLGRTSQIFGLMSSGHFLEIWSIFRGIFGCIPSQCTA